MISKKSTRSKTKMSDQFNLIKSLIKFVNNVEQKLLSMKLIEEKLNEFMSILAKTQENIFQDLKSIQKILNENHFEEDYDEFVFNVFVFNFLLQKICLSLKELFKSMQQNLNGTTTMMTMRLKNKQ